MWLGAPSSNVQAWHARGSAHVPPGAPVVGLYTLPAGNYLVWVTVSVVGEEGVLTCTLWANGTHIQAAGGTAVYSDRGESGHVSISTFVALATSVHIRAVRHAQRPIRGLWRDDGDQSGLIELVRACTGARRHPVDNKRYEMAWQSRFRVYNSSQQHTLGLAKTSRADKE